MVYLFKKSTSITWTELSLDCHVLNQQTNELPRILMKLTPKIVANDLLYTDF